MSEDARHRLVAGTSGNKFPQRREAPRAASEIADEVLRWGPRKDAGADEVSRTARRYAETNLEYPCRSLGAGDFLTYATLKKKGVKLASARRWGCAITHDTFQG